jgi:hypothetical protein
MALAICSGRAVQRGGLAFGGNRCASDGLAGLIEYGACDCRSAFLSAHGQ